MSYASSFREAGGAEAGRVCRHGALSALHRAGLRVPDDVVVVGYDDLPFAPYLVPALTPVRLPYAAMGEDAVSWLAEAVRGRVDGVLHQVYQPYLIIRDSG